MCWLDLENDSVLCLRSFVSSVADTTVRFIFENWLELFCLFTKTKGITPNPFKMFILKVLINGGIATMHGKVLGTIKELTNDV